MPLTLPPLDVAELCSSRNCTGAKLLLSQGTQLDVAWRAAQVVAAANGGRVALRLDSLPRQPQPKPGKMSTMLALLSDREIEDRARLEYGALYACLTKFPVQPDVPRRAFFSMNVNPDGIPSAVKLHALVDGVPPLRSQHPPPTPTTECLRQAFGQMAFSAPHYGKVARMLFGFHLNR
jgi:hypothetical protein